VFVGRLPGVWNSNDAAEFINIATAINADKMKMKVDKLDEKLLKAMAFTAQGSIAPLTSFSGGVVAQECLKALSGKYTPLNQFV
jgi:hypothetical protein